MRLSRTCRRRRRIQIFLYDCTEVSPFSLLFFGGDITIQKDGADETVAVDQWIVFRCPARIAHLVKVSSRIMGGGVVGCL